MTEVLKKIFSEKTAHILSMIFIPPSVVLGCMAFMGYLFEADRTNYLYILLYSFLFGFILPIAFFVFLMKRSKVSDVDARIKEERTIPYLFGISLLIIGAWIFHTMNINGYSFALWISFLIGNISLLIINRFWKISAHAMGVGMIAGAFAAVNVAYIPALAVIVLVIGWARLKLKCHTFSQVLAGASLGIIISFTNINLMNNV